jgi:hypothetical protein
MAWSYTLKIEVSFFERSINSISLYGVNFPEIITVITPNPYSNKIDRGYEFIYDVEFRHHRKTTRILGFRGGDYEEYRLLGFDAAWVYYKRKSVRRLLTD